MRAPSRIVALGISLSALWLSLAPAAFAGDAESTFDKAFAHVDWASHPGAAIAALVGMVLASLLACVGVGCAVALVGVVAPRLRDFVDSAARSASAGRMLLIGSLVLGGVLLALAAISKLDSSVVMTIAGIVLALPTFLLFVLGVLGALPLLGERLLGAGGATASPLRRSVTATLSIGLAIVPSFAFGATILGLLVGLVALAWPLGAGIEAVRSLFARRS